MLSLQAMMCRERSLILSSTSWLLRELEFLHHGKNIVQLLNKRNLGMQMHCRRRFACGASCCQRSRNEVHHHVHGVDQRSRFLWRRSRRSCSRSLTGCLVRQSRGLNRFLQVNLDTIFEPLMRGEDSLLEGIKEARK